MAEVLGEYQYGGLQYEKDGNPACIQEEWNLWE